MKRFSDACERNRDAILQVLRRVFADRKAVLEIGSGTGQHAAYFAPALPHLAWQPSDVAELLPSGGVFALYGPFNYGGKHTSPSNAEFDAWLRGRDPKSGVRDFEAIDALAKRHRLVLEEDNAMPANNRLLVFRKGP